jgi:hypothetical protein
MYQAISQHLRGVAKRVANRRAKEQYYAELKHNNSQSVLDWSTFEPTDIVKQSV